MADHVHRNTQVMVFFCTNLGNGPAGTPACPANGGTVTGTLTAASVVGPTAQNVSPGDFDADIAALNSNTSYANTETTRIAFSFRSVHVHRPTETCTCLSPGVYCNCDPSAGLVRRERTRSVVL